MFFNLSNFINFLVPQRRSHATLSEGGVIVTAIIPTLKPGEATFTLVENLLKFNVGIRVYVVDDCTPLDLVECFNVLERIK